MKNNAICFFIDSVSFSCISTNRASISPTPFLDSLKNESITTSNLYSHGPYTDAATRSLFTGRNCLDDFGYFFKLNTSPINHYKAFHDEGYEVYDFNYPYYIIGNNIAKYIDHAIYTSGFIFNSEWGGIFSYYHEIQKTRSLTKDEFLILKKRITLMFESWERYLKDAVNNADSFAIHNKILDTYNTNKALDTLLNEKDKFISYPEEYINNFIKEGKEHVLVNLDSSGIESYINNQFIDNYIESKYGSFLNQISWNNFKANFLRNIPSLKRICYAFKKYIQTKDSNNLLFLVNYLGCLTPILLMRKRWKKKGWQNQHTAYTIYQEGINILKKRKNSKPFYFFFDVEEPHNNIAFFSYDTQEKSVIDEEMTMLKEYVDKLGTNFKGNLLYLLSLRYTDYRIQKFCESLKELGLWDTTTILVITDHGSSYTYYPLHNRRVNCFDEECYHIPMLLRHPGMQGIEINTYQYSKDVLPTFMDVIGLELCKEFKGDSMLKEHEGRKFVIGEYMGPGCPDMLNRQIWFSARDKKYIIGYKISLNKSFENGELAEVYDLTIDPNGYYNINDKIEKEKIQYLLKAIEERFNEIKRETNEFIINLRNINN